MTKHTNIRGGAPVGHLAELGVIELQAVICLRMWCNGPDAQQRVWSGFADSLGPEAGREALEVFEEICTLCTRHGRRPLMRHQPTCRCLGADEACFANFVATAADGDREDALLIATLLVRADMAPALAALAATFGLALRRIDLQTPYRASPARHPTLH